MADTLTVALLNASVHDWTRQETLGNFNRAIDADLEEFAVTDGELPDNPTSFEGIIVTGSAASVYDDESWIDRTKTFVSDACDRGVPVLGVCFGHQLVADAIGGEVAAREGYEIGYHRIRHTGGELFSGIDEEFTAFTTHSDEVVALPPDAKVTARNEYGVQSFQRDEAYGVQFHPEYDAETAEKVTRSKDELAEDRRRHALDSITEENERAAAEAVRVFDNFVGRISD